MAHLPGSNDGARAILFKDIFCLDIFEHQMEEERSFTKGTISEYEAIDL
jgi:hypothetical protein